MSQAHWWTLFYFDCDQTIIDNLGWYNDYRNGMTITQPTVSCLSSPTSLCTSVGFSTILQRLYCTDYTDLLDLSSGASITKITLNRTANFLAGYSSSAWASEIKVTGTSISAGAWRIITRIDLTQKYPINSSPGTLLHQIIDFFSNSSMLSLVTGSLPIIRVLENTTAVIQVPAADWDLEDDVRCRWASATGAAGNECGDICGNMIGAVVGLR